MSRERLCDDATYSDPTIVPGDWVGTARYGGCETYLNQREMAEYSPGGRYNAYSGTCGACENVGATIQPKAANAGL